MTDDIPALTARLAAEPASLVFLDLGEALRRRGQLESALTVVSGGSQRYPLLADAHDLLARIHADRGAGDAAFDAWTEALRHDPRHLGALRGLAYLAYRAGDFARAERHLVAALAIVPDDANAFSALARVRERRQSELPPPAPVPAPSDEPIESVLVDAQGRRLSGTLSRRDGADGSDAVAAELVGVSREAARATRLLGLGNWRAVSIECAEVQFYIVPPTPETMMLARTESATPAGRLALFAERSAAAARRWLERTA
ncbi:MAG TPA: tetratricopeptide repeat protein [Gemmatimonadales bacterium]